MVTMQTRMDAEPPVRQTRWRRTAACGERTCAITALAMSARSTVVFELPRLGAGAEIRRKPSLMWWPVLASV